MQLSKLRRKFAIAQGLLAKGYKVIITAGSIDSAKQGADKAICLATEAPRNQTGKFWRDRSIIPD